ncbi:hypothetical protein DMN77_20460 [Paenibacillus sp. 79R4]|uniref:spore germination protein n=1 Tax=Paenibacillus sp. 79R4 TaxID=2212847 RepID=UPI0015C1B0B1|nr:spore germination protein [Paenibacillus sp. 79R4]NWL89926.1 hypothetical protein [Paenibacillus sp. 79R4]
MELINSVQSLVGENGDFGQRTLEYGNRTVHLFYFKSVCDNNKIDEQLIKPFYENPPRFMEYLCSFSGNKMVDEPEKAVKTMLSGYVLIILDGNSSILAVNMLQFKAKSLSEPMTEKVLLGNQHGLSTDLDVSLNLIRNAYRKSSFWIENRTIGLLDSTKILVLYDKDLVDPFILDEMKQRLDSVNLNVVIDIRELHQQLSPSRWSLFPLYLITERVDRILKNIQDGKVVVLIEGSPYALIAPSVLFDFFASMDDFSEISILSKFMLTLRYIAYMLTVITAPFYIMVVQYEPQILQSKLAMHIAGSRSMVPYSAAIELLFIMLMGEFLVEASLRIPSSIGQTATIVGGLILGEAASKAGFVSDVIIIVLAIMSVSSFVIPINLMAISNRVIRFPLAVIATFFGVPGFLIGMMGLLVYLCSLRSMGQPYFRLFTREKIHERKEG